MPISIVFIGKYDENMRKIEELVVNMLNGKEKIKLTEEKYPDVKKFQNATYNCDIWTIIGDVKPTLLLKNLISEADIIIFTFNFDDPETLKFLYYGWGPIIEKTNHQNEGILFVTGANSKKFDQIISELKSKNFDELIEKTKDRFKCTRPFISKETELIKYIQNEISTIRKSMQKQEDSKNIKTTNLPNNTKSKKEQENSKNIKTTNPPNNTNNKKEPNEDYKEKNLEKEKIEKIGDNKDEEEKDLSENIEKNEKEEEDLYENIEDKGKQVQITDKNHIEYRLFEDSHTASIIKISPEVKGDIFIPTFIEYQQQKFNITRIVDHAFSNSQINELSFSSKSRLINIGNYAFENSTLTKLIIPKSLKQFEEFCFEGKVQLKEIEVEKFNRYFKTNNFFLFYYPNGIDPKIPIEKQIYHKIYAKSDFSYNYKNPDVIEIEFIKNVNLLIYRSANTINLAGTNQFCHCQNIKHIKFESKKAQINANFYKNSEHIETIEMNVEEMNIDKECFTNCSKLKSISFSKLKTAIIDSQAFNMCKLLKNIDINSNVYLALKEKCFCGNQNIETMKISSNKVYTGPNCFLNSSLVSFSIEKSNSIKFYQNSFTSCSSLTDVRISAIKDIVVENYCFSNCKNLKSIIIEGIEKLQIPEGCFENCETLETVSIPDVTDITLLPYSFKGCHKIKQFLISQNLSKSTYQQKQKQEFNNYNDSIEMTLYEACFDNYFPISQITLNKIKTLAIHFNKINYEIINKFTSLNTIIINSEEEITIQTNSFCKLNSLERIEINTASLITILEGFLSNTINNKITNIELKSKTINIKENSFNQIPNLEIISIQSEQIQINSNCFNKLHNLHTIYLESTEINIQNSCFQNCSNLKHLTIKNITYIELGYQIFINCNRLNEIDINLSKSKDFLKNKFKIVRPIGSTKSTFIVEENKAETENKFISKSIMKETKNKKDLLSFFNQILEISKLNHPTILGIQGISFYNFDNKPYPIIFRKFIDGNSLEEILNKNNYTNEQKYNILIGITIGMKYLHSKLIIHGNLKPSNIIIDEQFIPHICDYFIIPSNKTRYSSPESSKTNQNSNESDIYSYSLICIEIFTGKSPFINKMNVKPTLEHIKESHIRHFFERCISITPSNRPSFDDILNEITEYKFIKTFNLDVTKINSLINSYEIEIKNQPNEPNQKSKLKIELKSKEQPNNESKEQLMIERKEPSNDPSSNAIIPNDLKHESPDKKEALNANVQQSANNLLNNPVSNQLIITIYLQKNLYTDKDNLLVIKIEDRSKISGSLKDIASKFIDTKNLDYIYYTINHKTGYIVEKISTEMSIEKLPAKINIQMKPVINLNYRIFIICEYNEIKSNLNLNENCFSFAIEFDHRYDIKKLKQKVIDYLKINNLVTNNDLYIYINKGENLIPLQKYGDSKNERIPLFISFKSNIYQQVKEKIKDHMIIETIQQDQDIISLMNTKNQVPKKEEKLKSINQQANNQLLVNDSSNNFGNNKMEIKRYSKSSIDKIDEKSKMIGNLNNKIIFTRYLKTKLYGEETYVLKIEIKNKLQHKESLINFSSKMLTNLYNKTLYYTINPKSNYQVKIYEKDNLVKEVNSNLTIQYQPSKNDFRIIVICDIKEIEQDFQMNENCFSFAIEFVPKYSIKQLKQKIKDYLILSKPLDTFDPTVCIFKNDHFQSINECKECSNERIPIFVSYNPNEFQQIKKYINDHTELRIDNFIRK